MVNLEKEVADILRTYSGEVKEKVRKVSREVARDCASRLQSSSPKESGEYASGWGVKTQGENGQVVYNKAKPSLTHLLENGHASTNQYGSYGRVPGRSHIAPVEQWGIVEMEARIRRELEG